jgi:hypothetical protein
LPSVNEQTSSRMVSVGTGRRTHHFRDAVPSRDGRCWITGEEPPSVMTARWALSLPPGHSQKAEIDDWWVIDLSVLYSLKPCLDQGPDSYSDAIHQLFDSYGFSIKDVCVPYIFYKDPTTNNGFRITTKVFFTNDASKNRSEKHIERSLLDHPHRPVDQLLRWHFRGHPD